MVAKFYISMSGNGFKSMYTRKLLLLRNDNIFFLPKEQYTSVETLRCIFSIFDLEEKKKEMTTQHNYRKSCCKQAITIGSTKSDSDWFTNGFVSSWA